MTSRSLDLLCQLGDDAVVDSSVCLEARVRPSDRHCIHFPRIWFPAAGNSLKCNVDLERSGTTLVSTASAAASDVFVGWGLACVNNGSLPGLGQGDRVTLPLMAANKMRNCAGVLVSYGEGVIMAHLSSPSPRWLGLRERRNASLLLTRERASRSSLCFCLEHCDFDRRLSREPFLIGILPPAKKFNLAGKNLESPQRCVWHRCKSRHVRC